MTLIQIILLGVVAVVFLLIVGTIAVTIFQDLNDKDSRGGMP